MSSPAANKRKGAAFEIELMKGFREAGFDIERLRLAGKDDEGDLVIRGGNLVVRYTVIEAKSGALHPAEFVREARTERLNFAKHRDVPDDNVQAIVIAKARGKNWRDAYVLTTVRDYFRLDEL
ncbi:hypothetical protein [Actinoplanes sp. NPDC026670]|uniref:hypothetical protein n=1 Tax=Actinoplanes sp. NPDC026670 TaxID=3154700 RepID=UPI0033D85400